MPGFPDESGNECWLLPKYLGIPALSGKSIGDGLIYSREGYNSHIGGFPKPGEAIRGAPEALQVKRSWADARKTYYPGET